MDKMSEEMFVFDIDNSLLSHIIENVEMVDGHPANEFSFNTQSKIQFKKEYLEDRFFQANFSEWHTHVLKPFCTLRGKHEDESTKDEEEKKGESNDISLGSVYDLDLAKDIMMQDNGFNEDDFPKAVKDEANKAKTRFHAELERLGQGKSQKYNQKHQRQEKRNLFCFSIDNKRTRAIDDAISIQKVETRNADAGASAKADRQFWKIGVHIADLNEFVCKNKPLDKEAHERVNSKYIGNYFFKSMLPRVIYDQIGSLKSSN